MRIIAKSTLLGYIRRHADCAEPLLNWYRVASAADWASIEEVRRTFPSADPVGDKTVFNIKGNSYRLIVAIHYNRRHIYIREFLTHAEYDRGAWNSKSR